METPDNSDGTIHDVIIIGAGPCGLAVAARLCEHTPSAIFTDEEHRRYHWIKKHNGQMSIKHKKDGSISTPQRPWLGRKYSTLVLDATGDNWMARWNTLFKTFEITHLRSPMFFHVDPGDRDGLLAYTHEQNRQRELEEIRECVGKEISKHHKKKRAKSIKQRLQAEVVIDERDRKDYFTPSRSLFSDHCACVINRYGLREGLIRKEEVQDIKYGYVDGITETGERVFAVHTGTKTHHSRTVVLAVGPGNPPKIPGMEHAQRIQGACHSMHIKRFPDASTQKKIDATRVTNVMVVGGGLTSAQISDLAIRCGVTKVWHIMRGPLKVKPFDIELAWMGKFRNLEQAVFWSADSDEERLEQIRLARGGGSITPRFYKALKRHISASKISLHLHTTLSSQTYDTSTETWSICTNPPIPDLPPIDYIYFATGIITDFTTLPLLRTMNSQYPIPAYGGLPCLTDDLMWAEGVPLFVTGRLASLRLGPGAANLAGARVGAERIAWSIEDLLGSGSRRPSGEEAERFEYTTGRGNMFESLKPGEEE
ncbi:FAD binding domain-containing protein [Glonium stellatum]|uniref:L-ornithine N(5)-monooxygenase [NAD(P)H] n=1 Tax=Glonium stellatum TaxID=574774 RepID=A0A8E2FEH7_9PEZI|nr:FAD binding domain-containing protein [Glonium stellatum]